jgi:signal transduction histidine kinase
LRVALMHLLGNALKFSRSRTPAVIEIGGESDVVAGITKLTIRDNGVGYNPVMQGKLFQVFSRLHSQTQFEGLGMGLALSRKIAQRLGAELAISGKTDLGCCVTLTLPLAAP